MKKILCILFIVVLVTTFTFSIFADSVTSETRSNFYVSNYPLNMSVQVNGELNKMTSFGDLGASFPLKYDETYGESTWYETLYSTKTTAIYPDGETIYSRCTLVSEQALNEALLDISTTYFGQTEYTSNVVLYVENAEYNTITATESLSLYLTSANGTDVTLYEEPEYYITSVIYKGTSAEAISELGIFASCFNFEEFTESGNVSVETNTYSISSTNTAVRNNEANGFRAVLSTELSPSLNTLFYVDGFYQFRPTFGGGGFTMFRGEQPTPSMVIGDKTAKVVYNVTFAYVMKSITSGNIDIGYHTYTATETNATNGIYILPSFKELTADIDPPTGYMSAISTEYPYILIESYTTEISVRRVNIDSSFTVRNYFGELETSGIPRTFSDASHFLNSLNFNHANSGGGAEDFSALGGFITSSVGGFFNTPIFSGYSIGSIMMLVIAIGVIFALLKFFAGG